MASPGHSRNLKTVANVTNGSDEFRVLGIELDLVAQGVDATVQLQPSSRQRGGSTAFMTQVGATAGHRLGQFDLKLVKMPPAGDRSED